MKGVRLAVGVVALIAAVLGCGDDPNAIKIAVAGPFSGSAAAYGEMVKKGATLKAEEINAGGGIQGRRVKLVFGDDGGDPKDAATVATRFASDPTVPVVIGHFNSSCTLAGKPIYRDRGVVQLSPGSTNVNVCEGSEWTFRAIYRDDFQGMFLARYAGRKLGFRKAAVFYDNDDYGTGLKTAFSQEARRCSLRVVVEAGYPREATDFTPALTAVKGSGVDVIFIAGLYREAALITRQARKLGMALPILGADGLASPGYVELAKGDAEGTLLTTPFRFDAGGEKAQAMLRAFRAKYQEDPDCWAALTYDSVGLAAHVIAKVGTDRRAIREALAGMQTREAGYEGVTGAIFFDANRECQRPAYVSVIRGGAVVAAPVQMLE